MKEEMKTAIANDIMISFGMFSIFYAGYTIVIESLLALFMLVCGVILVAVRVEFVDNAEAVTE